MIVRITGYKGFSAVVAVHSGPDGQWVMGRFPEARWNPAERVYVARAADVAQIVAAFEAEPGALVLDERETDWAPPPYRRTFAAAPGNPAVGAAACRRAMRAPPTEVEPDPEPVGLFDPEEDQ